MDPNARGIISEMLDLVNNFENAFKMNSLSTAYALILLGSNLVDEIIQKLPNGELRNTFMVIKVQNAPVLQKISSGSGSLNDVLNFLTSIAVELGAAIRDIQVYINRLQIVKKYYTPGYYLRL